MVFPFFVSSFAHCRSQYDNQATDSDELICPTDSVDVIINRKLIHLTH